MTDPLTPRQAAVARLLVRGHTVERIAAELRCSPHTVARHIKDAAARLPGPGRPQYKLLRYAALQQLRED